MTTETLLVEYVKNYFKKDYRIYEEVGLLSRTIDLVLKDKENIISVECKINDWRKAIKQASDHQTVADYSYICMPDKNFSSEFYELLEQKGIGLLVKTEHSIEEKIKAQKTSIFWHVVRKHFEENLSAMDTVYA